MNQPTHSTIASSSWCVSPDAIGDQLDLERVDERLGRRVIEGVADGPDRREDAMVIEDLREREARVLPGIKESSQHGLSVKEP